MGNCLCGPSSPRDNRRSRKSRRRHDKKRSHRHKRSHHHGCSHRRERHRNTNRPETLPYEAAYGSETDGSLRSQRASLPWYGNTQASQDGWRSDSPVPSDDFRVARVRTLSDSIDSFRSDSPISSDDEFPAARVRTLPNPPAPSKHKSRAAKNSECYDEAPDEAATKSKGPSNRLATGGQSSRKGTRQRSGQTHQSSKNQKSHRHK